MKPATVNTMSEYHTLNLYCFTDGETEALASLCKPMTFKSVFSFVNSYLF